jgi:hypothetical protein
MIHCRYKHSPTLVAWQVLSVLSILTESILILWIQLQQAGSKNMLEIALCLVRVLANVSRNRIDILTFDTFVPQVVGVWCVRIVGNSWKDQQDVISYINCVNEVILSRFLNIDE